MQFVEKIKEVLQNFNSTKVTVAEEVAILSVVETVTLSAVYADTKLRGSFLKKIRVKTSDNFRERERIKFEMILFFTLIGINVGVNYFDKLPEALREYDLNKVIKVVFNSLIRRGLNLLNLPNKLS